MLFFLPAGLTAHSTRCLTGRLAGGLALPATPIFQLLQVTFFDYPDMLHPLSLLLITLGKNRYSFILPLHSLCVNTVREILTVYTYAIPCAYFYFFMLNWINMDGYIRYGGNFLLHSIFNLSGYAVPFQYG